MRATSVTKWVRLVIFGFWANNRVSSTSSCYDGILNPFSFITLITHSNKTLLDCKEPLRGTLKINRIGNTLQQEKNG